MQLRNKLIFSLLLLWSVGCKKSSNDLLTGDYPTNIHQIITTNCAVTGCHNATSKDAAAGVDLTSWSTMMNGGRNGQVVIPYNASQSTLFLFTNTYEDLGVSVFPTMPLNEPALSKIEMNQLINWIQQGAKNDKKETAFADNHERLKYYVLNAVCDEISVIDANSGLIMRSHSPPISEDPGFAEMIRVSSDRQFVYLLFTSGLFVKFDANSDEYIQQIQLTSGLWRSFVLDQNSQKAYLFEWLGNSDNQGAHMASVDLSNMSLEQDPLGDVFYFPYGGAIHASKPMLYVSCFTGNFIYKINTVSHTVDTILLDTTSGIQFNGASQRPGMIKFFPDDSRYAVVCERSNEVRIYDAITDKFLASIKTGQHPQEIAFSSSMNTMAITCMEDESFDEGKGYVMLVNTEDYSIKANVNSGYQPRAIIADDVNYRYVVANRNADPIGADAPHHYTDCDGNNGYITFIDMFSLKMIENYKLEVSVDPYSMDIK